MWERHIIGLCISKYRVVKEMTYKNGCDDGYYIGYS